MNLCVDVVDLFSIEGFLVESELLTDPDPLCAGEAPEIFGFSTDNDGNPWFEGGDSLEDPPLCDPLVDNEAQVIPLVPNGPLASSVVETTLFNADCVFGCMLTPGYWKTHSAYGPAPYDDTWALVGSNDPAWTAATGVFENCEPEDFVRSCSGRFANGGGCTGTTAADLVALAEILDDYNNGLIGPGHCSEDGFSE